MEFRLLTLGTDAVNWAIRPYLPQLASGATSLLVPPPSFFVDSVFSYVMPTIKQLVRKNRKKKRKFSESAPADAPLPESAPNLDALLGRESSEETPNESQSDDNH